MATKTKEKVVDPTEKHVLIMFSEVCKHCGGRISIVGSTFEYVWVRCHECGSEHLGGYTTLTQTIKTEVASD